MALAAILNFNKSMVWGSVPIISCWTHLICCLQYSSEQISFLDTRLDFTNDQQRALVADHVPHGLPVYVSTEPAYLLHHTHFVSAYNAQLRQPMWTAANISLNKASLIDWIY